MSQMISHEILKEKKYHAVYRLYYEVWNQKKLNIIDEIFAPDFSIYAGHFIIDTKQVLIELISSWQTSFPDIHHEIDDVIVKENKLALRFHGNGTHKEKFLDISPTNKTFSYTGMNFIYLENGKIKKLWLNSSIYEMVKHLRGD